MDAKRIAFIEQNKCWIDFLNDYNSGELEKNDEETLTEKRVNGEIIKQNKLNLLMISSKLKEIQKAINPDKRFSSEKEFILAIAGWMYENINLAFSHDKKDFEYKNKVDWMLIETLLNQIKVSFINQTANGGFDYDFGIDSKIPYVTRYLHVYLDYMQKLQAGVEDCAKIGIYKVGVCPHHKLKDKKPCGMVFICEKHDQRACKKHAKIWQVLKAQRAKLAKIAKGYKKS